MDLGASKANLEATVKKTEQIILNRFSTACSPSSFNVTPSAVPFASNSIYKASTIPVSR
jgi:hypothetical protein